MKNNENINFIEDITPIDGQTTNIDNHNEKEIIQSINQKPTQQINQNSEYIKELPKWDINPPLEINRGEK